MRARARAHVSGVGRDEGARACAAPELVKRGLVNDGARVEQRLEAEVWDARVRQRVCEEEVNLLGARRRADECLHRVVPASDPAWGRRAARDPAWGRRAARDPAWGRSAARDPAWGRRAARDPAWGRRAAGGQRAGACEIAEAVDEGPAGGGAQHVGRQTAGAEERPARRNTRLRIVCYYTSPAPSQA
eukprot:4478771-Prymnesium_polylepis.1